MNKFRKSQINGVVDELKTIYNSLDNCYYKLDDIHSDEEDYLENIPENMQEGDWFEEKDEKCDAFDDIVNDLNELNETLSEITERLFNLY